jgi:hypothetical protein
MQKEGLKEKFKNIFEKAYGKKLSDAQIEEIIINLTGFFKLLSDYNKKDTDEQCKL